MRSVGTLRLVTSGLFDRQWELTCEPHVATLVKRLFPRVGMTGQRFWLPNTPANCADLVWLSQRFEITIEHAAELIAGASKHREKLLTLDRVLTGKHVPIEFKLALPPRDYQRAAADLWCASKSLLLADTVGLGKTCSAICGLTGPGMLPAVVVTLTHLTKQWEREINRFAPELRTHVLKKGTPYALPNFMGRAPDVLILNYHKLGGWCDVLTKRCGSVIWDEVQELRHSGTTKAEAAERIARAAEARIGLSATPIYNYGGEMFNVMQVIAPDVLGSEHEFAREWCVGYGEKAYLERPDEFGSWLKSEGLMLRRTRADVGRELPKLDRVEVPIEADEAQFDKAMSGADELARLILEGTKQARGAAMQQAAEFDARIRQATGIAKAPGVAAFVEMLIRDGEQVVLFGWHHAVYQIWMERLMEFEPQLYTGEQSPQQKQRAVDEFVAKRSKVLILSLRAGAGLDGLQFASNTVVIGELDWSPQVHDQCIGRVDRDGQTKPVTAYFAVSESGADPLIAEVCGLKREQSDGLLSEQPLIMQRAADSENTRRLAQQFLERAKT